MKKQLLLLAGLLLFAGVLPAQQDEIPAVVIFSKGKVKYKSANKAIKTRVASGAILNKSGTLRLKKNASALVCSEGSLKRLSGKGVFALSDVFKAGSLATLNFDPEFAKYVLASAESTGDKRSGDGMGSTVTDPKQSGDGMGVTVTDPKQSGDGMGVTVTDPKQSGDGMGNTVTDPKQSGDGWGGQGSRIYMILPYGNVTADVVNFNWSKPAGSHTYKLELFDDNNKVQYSTAVQDTFATVDLGKINLSVNSTYSWQVFVPDNGKLVSGHREFTVSTPEAQTAAAKKASSSATYRNGEPVVQGMMEAVALEKAQWYTAAEQVYAGLIRQYPNDLMVRRLYAAFWMRFGLEPMAKKVLKGS